MKKIKKHSDELDQFFKEGLNDFQVPPPSRDGNEDNPLDDLFRSELDQYEATPSPEVWDKVKTRIPLSLKMKRQLTWWTKIAAALILGLTATVAIKEYQKANAQEIVIEEVQEAVLETPNNAPSSYIDKEVVVADDDTEPSALEMLDDNFNEIEVNRSAEIAPIEQLDTKLDEVIGSIENPLDDQQKKSKDHGEMPLRIDKSDVAGSELLIKNDGLSQIEGKSDQKEEQEEEEKQK